MDNNPNQPNSTSVNTNESKQSTNLAASGKVIQPVNDMSEYTVQHDPSQPTTPTAPPKPLDTSKIYPDTKNIAQPQQPGSPVTNSQEGARNSSQRVVSIVPALQVYAFLTIIYSLYSLFTFFSFLSMTQSLRNNLVIASKSNYLSPALVSIIAVAAINIATGTYLLIAKNIKTVSALLTALLIISGLSLLRLLVTTANYISHLSAASIISVLISIGLFLYLWNVKSQVDLAAIENK